MSKDLSPVTSYCIISLFRAVTNNWHAGLKLAVFFRKVVFCIKKQASFHHKNCYSFWFTLCAKSDCQEEESCVLMWFASKLSRIIPI